VRCRPTCRGLLSSIRREDRARKTVQMGVHLTQAQAEAAWQRAVSDYTYLVTMPKSIEPITIRSKRYYRLQLGTPSKRHAKQLCTNLKSIGRAGTVA
jgi:hypothetical protein